MTHPLEDNLDQRDPADVQTRTISRKREFSETISDGFDKRAVNHGPKPKRMKEDVGSSLVTSDNVPSSEDLEGEALTNVSAKSHKMTLSQITVKAHSLTAAQKESEALDGAPAIVKTNNTVGQKRRKRVTLPRSFFPLPTAEVFQCPISGCNKSWKGTTRQASWTRHLTIIHAFTVPKFFEANPTPVNPQQDATPSAAPNPDVSTADSNLSVTPEIARTAALGATASTSSSLVLFQGEKNGQSGEQGSVVLWSGSNSLAATSTSIAVIDRLRCQILSSLSECGRVLEEVDQHFSSPNLLRAWPESLVHENLIVDQHVIRIQSTLAQISALQSQASIAKAGADVGLVEAIAQAESASRALEKAIPTLRGITQVQRLGLQVVRAVQDGRLGDDEPVGFATELEALETTLPVEPAPMTLAHQSPPDHTALREERLHLRLQFRVQEVRLLLNLIPPTKGRLAFIDDRVAAEAGELRNSGKELAEQAAVRVTSILDDTLSDMADLYLDDEDSLETKVDAAHEALRLFLSALDDRVKPLSGDATLADFLSTLNQMAVIPATTRVGEYKQVTAADPYPIIAVLDAVIQDRLSIIRFEVAQNASQVGASLKALRLSKGLADAYSATRELSKLPDLWQSMELPEWQTIQGVTGVLQEKLAEVEKVAVNASPRIRAQQAKLSSTFNSLPPSYPSEIKERFRQALGCLEIALCAIEDNCSGLWGVLSESLSQLADARLFLTACLNAERELRDGHRFLLKTQHEISRVDVDPDDATLVLQDIIKRLDDWSKDHLERWNSLVGRLDELSEPLGLKRCFAIPQLNSLFHKLMERSRRVRTRGLASRTHYTVGMARSKAFLAQASIKLSPRLRGSIATFHSEIGASIEHLNVVVAEVMRRAAEGSEALDWPALHNDACNLFQSFNDHQIARLVVEVKLVHDWLERCIKSLTDQETSGMRRMRAEVSCIFAVAADHRRSIWIWKATVEARIAIHGDCLPTEGLLRAMQASVTSMEGQLCQLRSALNMNPEIAPPNSFSSLAAQLQQERCRAVATIQPQLAETSSRISNLREIVERATKEFSVTARLPDDPKDLEIASSFRFGNDLCCLALERCESGRQEIEVAYNNHLLQFTLLAERISNEATQATLRQPINIGMSETSETFADPQKHDVDHEMSPVSQVVEAETRPVPGEISGKGSANAWRTQAEHVLQNIFVPPALHGHPPTLPAPVLASSENSSNLKSYYEGMTVDEAKRLEASAASVGLQPNQAPSNSLSLATLSHMYIGHQADRPLGRCVSVEEIPALDYQKVLSDALCLNATSLSGHYPQNMIPSTDASDITCIISGCKVRLHGTTAFKRFLRHIRHDHALHIPKQHHKQNDRDPTKGSSLSLSRPRAQSFVSSVDSTSSYAPSRRSGLISRRSSSVSIGSRSRVSRQSSLAAIPETSEASQDWDLHKFEYAESAYAESDNSCGEAPSLSSGASQVPLPSASADTTVGKERTDQLALRSVSSSQEGAASLPEPPNLQYKSFKPQIPRTPQEILDHASQDLQSTLFISLPKSADSHPIPTPDGPQFANRGSYPLPWSIGGSSSSWNPIHSPRHGTEWQEPPRLLADIPLLRGLLNKSIPGLPAAILPSDSTALIIPTTPPHPRSGLQELNTDAKVLAAVALNDTTDEAVNNLLGIVIQGAGTFSLHTLTFAAPCTTIDLPQPSVCNGPMMPLSSYVDPMPTVTQSPATVAPIPPTEATNKAARSHKIARLNAARAKAMEQSHTLDAIKKLIKRSDELPDIIRTKVTEELNMMER